jgi:hypothetical protein
MFSGLLKSAISMNIYLYERDLIAHDGANIGLMVLEGRMLSTAGAVLLVQVLYTNTCFDNPLNKWTGMIDTAWNVSSVTGRKTIFLPWMTILFLLMFPERLLDQDRSVTPRITMQSIYGMFLKGNKLTLKNLLFSGGCHRLASW